MFSLTRSRMQHQHHGLARIILPLFFKRIRFEAPQAELIRAALQHSCVVYVSRFNGQLEYLAHAHFFEKHGLPLAEYSNHINLIWWIKLREAWKLLQSASQQETEPLKKLINKKRALFLHLPLTSLTDPALFHSSSQNPLTLLLQHRHEQKIPITLVPVEFLWDRYESKRSSLMDLLGLDPDNFGFLRRFVLFWKHYFSSGTIRVGTPFTLEELQQELPSAALLEHAESLRLQLLERLHIERRTVTGAPLRPRSWFLEQIFHDEQLLQELTSLAHLNQSSTDELLQIAHNYARKMVAAPDPLFIQIASRLLKRILHRFFCQIHFSPEATEQLKLLTSKHAVVLVPNHRSHMDYLLLSSLCHEAGLNLPLIAAGDNLSFWPLGNIFRRGGAFFIQRSFKNQPAYRLVVEAYLRVLVREHYLVEFFIEGTRSRSGKLFPARLGLLKMLLSAAQATSQSELVFIPVAITYERILEMKSYVEEAEGKRKKKESRFDLLKLIHLFRNKKIHGELSILFAEAIHTSAPDWQNEDKTQILVHRLMNSIAENFVITPNAITSATLLSFPQTNFSVTQAKHRLQLFLKFLNPWAKLFTENLRNNSAEALEKSFLSFVQEKWLQQKNSAEHSSYFLSPQHRLQFEYYKNGLMHIMYLPSFVCWLLLKKEKQSYEELHARCLEIHQLLLLEFPDHSSISATVLQQSLEQLLQAQALSCENNVYFIPKPLPEITIVLATLLEPLLEAYALFYQANQNATFALDEKHLLKRANEHGARKLKTGQLLHPQAINQWYLKNALRRAQELNILVSSSACSAFLSVHPHAENTWASFTKLFAFSEE